ncbi:hypothetical protein [uncultured Roseibium sp.]|uniref:hypothetical protein n=1 Tax=uncultured Roseibium sp. TaxID=1936171 RepID=UPI0026276F91|nr:hypothetical protein [uncultured Roseibium sp.]
MKETNTEEFNNTNQEIPFSNEERRPSLTIDVDYYQSFLDDQDIPDEKKGELIEVLWSIIVSIVDLGFGLHPVQQAQEIGVNAETAKAIKMLIAEDNQLQKEIIPEGVENEF